MRAMKKERDKRYEREAVALEEVGHSDITRAQKWCLTVFFLLLIFGIPAVQSVYEIRQWRLGENETVLPASFKIYETVSKTVKMIFGDEFSPTQKQDMSADEGLIKRIFVANRVFLHDIHLFENELSDQSLLTQGLISPVQYFQTKWLKSGNEEAYLGQDRWLFYRPGIDYVTGPGFLDPKQIVTRAKSGKEWERAPQPDPLIAIFQFHKQLIERGIQLVIMVAPVKPIIHPEKFSDHYEDYNQPLQNPSFSQFKRELENPCLFFERYAGFMDTYENVPIEKAEKSWYGAILKALRELHRGRDLIINKPVLLYDPASMMVNEKNRTKTPQYHESDTHWRPDTMGKVVHDFAEFIKQNTILPDTPEVIYHRAPLTVTNLGDIAKMLNLPESQTMFKDKTATVEQVVNDESLWRPDKNADVLLLGDSFTNIYSQQEMGWGESAGLGEQLSYELKRPLDLMVRNDAGAHATREMLSTELQRGNDRLAGKKLVIWEFVSRELSVGDWRTDSISMTPGKKKEADFVSIPAGENWLLSGIVEDIAAVPRPGTVAYSDHVTYIHLSQLRSLDGKHYPGKDALIAMYGMRNQVWTKAARYRIGERIQLRLRNYDEIDSAFKVSRTKSTLLEGDLLLEEPCWGEEVDRSTETIMGKEMRIDEDARTINDRNLGIAVVFTVLAVLAAIMGMVKWAEYRESDDRAKTIKWTVSFVIIALMLSGGLFWQALTWGGSKELDNMDVKSTAFGMTKVQAQSDARLPTTPKASDITDSAAMAFEMNCAKLAESASGMTVAGKEGWLFLRNELRHLGRDLRWGEMARASSDRKRKDPLSAILHYKRQLDSLGWELILVPIPAKAVVYPEMITDNVKFEKNQDPPRMDTQFQAFCKMLQGYGVNVVDLYPALVSDRFDVKGPIYCKTDAHWSGLACIKTAKLLADVIKTRPWYKDMKKCSYEFEDRKITIRGDLLRNMKTGPKPPPETLRLRFVGTRDGNRLQPVEEDPDSPVIVLADSHGLVFHMGGDMFAKGAGFVDQLALELGFPIDLYSTRGSAATVVRVDLYRALKKKLQQDPNYLQRKKLVIWCFSVRELTETTGWSKVPVVKRN